MIEIICDKCETPFEVEDALAGGKTACPDCGDINRVPTTAVKAPVAPIAAAAAVPASKGTMAAGGRGEVEVLVVRPAMARAHPMRALVILALLVGGAALAVFAPRSEAMWDGLTWVGGVLGLVGLAWWIKWWIAAHLWIKVAISNKRTVRHEGIVRRHSTEVLHDHVRSVDINQNFMQRLFNVGYIGIDSAGQDGIEIEIRDIPAPYEVKRVIDQYRSM